MHVKNTHRAYSSMGCLAASPSPGDQTRPHLQDMHPKKEFITKFSPGIPFKYISRAISPSNAP